MPSPDVRTYHRAQCVVFLKTHEAFGGLSNMAGSFPLSVNGVRILTSEALYQACRFPHLPVVQREIIAQRSPMTAKMKSKPYRKHSRPDFDALRVQFMRWCLQVKLAQHWERFGELLLATDDKDIVEESRRDDFWGAKPRDDGTLVGTNALGRLLMELRAQLRDADTTRLGIVEPLDVPDFLLLGEPIGIVRGHVPGEHRTVLAEVRHMPPAQQLSFASTLDSQVPSESSTTTEHVPQAQLAGDRSMAAPTTPYRRKLIEVALPLEAINKQSAREKSIRHGHPSTLHLWWSRKPLATCRAVLFAQMVDDPASLPDEYPSEEAQEAERLRLFGIIEELVKWENTTDEAVLHAARVEIARSAARNHGVSLPHSMTPAEVADALKRYAPPVLDPFAGGGSIPLEAQRLGLEAHASDLNPVAVLIEKALIEIPPKFAGRPPVNPEWDKKYLPQKEWKGAEGLAEDVRYYGRWMRDEAYKRIGHLYPRVRLPKEQGGGEATVIAWLWARTVTCPNPACGARMLLTSKWTLSTKTGKEAWVEPRVDRATTPPAISFAVRQGPGAPEGTVSRTGARCIACGTSVPFDYVRAEGKAGRMVAQMMAIVAEGKGGRVYLPPSEEQAAIAAEAEPHDVPDTDLPEQALGFRVQGYGMTKHRDLFTPRQLVALTTFSDLVGEARERVLAESGGDATYADAVATYLALATDRLAESLCTLARWQSTGDKVAGAFGRQALPMVWDYAEVNPFSGSTRNFLDGVEWVAECFDTAPRGQVRGIAKQLDATSAINGISHPIISTDPPYYDQIGYADLSDFFYVWLRRSLGGAYPELFGTLLVPKAAELVATPYRFGGSAEKARRFFEEGLGKAFARMREAENVDYPLTVYYAFKQAESDAIGDDDAENGKSGRNGNAGIASTGWETMLEGLLRAGFSVHGTWPVRSERGARMRSLDSNALASSIVLVCRPRPVDAPLATRRDFLNALKRELPHALRDLQRGLIAPVDLAQAAIGPGMAVFSRYSRVLESDGGAMRVRTALQLINQTLDEVLAEQEGEYDADTRWAVAWFEQYGINEGPYGVAETLSKAKNTAVGALVEAGIVHARGGKVRLVGRDELPEPWNPATARRLTVWEVTQRLIRALETEGEQGAAAILDAVPGDYGEIARDLAYRLYTVCERKKWADEARAYNSLVVEWSGIAGEAERLERTTAKQGRIW